MKTLMMFVVLVLAGLATACGGDGTVKAQEQKLDRFQVVEQYQESEFSYVILQWQDRPMMENIEFRALFGPDAATTNLTEPISSTRSDAQGFFMGFEAEEHGLGVVNAKRRIVANYESFLTRHPKVE